ncbi:MAG: DUF4160 domain-containing protein [Planctomycetes bacterium]|nr:DUF4160 domain-containing protein [Planctomycetota bacterium]
MPTVLRIGSTRFFFYSNEGNEPPHIHIEQAGALASSGVCCAFRALPAAP